MAGLVPTGIVAGLAFVIHPIAAKLLGIGHLRRKGIRVAWQEETPRGLRCSGFWRAQTLLTTIVIVIGTHIGVDRLALRLVSPLTRDRLWEITAEEGAVECIL